MTYLKSSDGAAGRGAIQAQALAAALRLRQAGKVAIGACPCCGYKDAFNLCHENGRTLLHCHAGCAQADLLAVLRRAGLWGSADLPRRGAAPATPDPRHRDGAQPAARAKRLWSASLALPGTASESYLRARNLTATPDELRFLPRHNHRPSGTAWPVMLAAVRDAAGRLVAVHRTYLRTDGSGKAPVEPAKMTLGPVGGSSVHLVRPGPCLIVGEGIESTLSAMAGSTLPGWASLSAGGLRALILPPLPLAASVTIAADADPVGLAAAHDAARRWHGEGRTVRLAVPPKPHTDWNDALHGERDHAT